MKILIVSYVFPPNAGGAASLLYNLCKFLPKEKYVVITVNNEPSIRNRCFDKDFTLDCNTVRLSTGNYAFNSLFFSLKVAFKGISLNKSDKFDCILAVHPSIFNLLGAFILHKIIRKPLVLYLHDLISTSRDSIKRAFWDIIAKIVLLDSNLILVTNETFQRYYARKGIKTEVFPHCIELFDRKIVNCIEKSAKDKIKIVFTGMIYEANEDAILSFLDSVKKIARPNIEIVFATQTQKEYIKNFGIGFLPKEKCFELQRSADILLLPLAFKAPYPEEILVAFPYKTLEYLNAGKPILAIAPKGSFLEKFIRNSGVGVVVTDPTTENIMSALEVLSDPEKRKNFSEKALEVIKNFDAKIRAQELYTLLQNMKNNMRK